MDKLHDTKNRGVASTQVKRLFDWQKWLVILIILLTAIFGALYLRQGSKLTKSIHVPKFDLPAYHLIRDSDLIAKNLPVEHLNDKVLIAKEDLINYYTLKTLKSGEVVTKSDIISISSSDLMSYTIAVSIPATAAMTFNGQLTSKTVVSVWSVTRRNADLLLPSVLVLDVKQVQAGANTSDNTYVIVLAVPEDHVAEILAASGSGSLSFTLAP